MVHEDRGPAKLKLVLDQAGVESMTIQVITTSITATGEYICIHIRMYDVFAKVLEIHTYCKNYNLSCTCSNNLNKIYFLCISIM